MKILITSFLVLFLSSCGTTHNTIMKQDDETTETMRKEVVIFSLSLLDTKYKWGSKKPDFGIDCSGLVSYVYKNSVNITISGAAKDIAKKGITININNIAPGDLIFFNTTGTPYSHVGIYLGKNKFIHASSKGGQVQTSDINQPYYQQHLTEIKRIIKPL